MIDRPWFGSLVLLLPDSSKGRADAESLQVKRYSGGMRRRLDVAAGAGFEHQL